MGYLELVAIGFVIIGWIIRTIYRFTKWTVRRAKVQGPLLSPNSQPITKEAQRPLTVMPPVRRLSNPRPQNALSGLPDSSRPVVSREATRADFSKAEQELQTFEPSPLYSALDSLSITPIPKQFPIFQNTDDLVRAIILQEILNPPRSRRMSSG